MKPCLTVVVLLLLPSLALAEGGAFSRQDSGLSVKMQLADGEGRIIERPQANTDFTITLVFTDALQGKPVERLRPLAWVRRLVAGATTCTNAAWSVRVTNAFSPTDIPLDRAYLISIGRDHAAAPDNLRVLDLNHRVKSANQISVTPLGGQVTGFVVHQQLSRAFLLRQGTNDIVAVQLPWGGSTAFARGLDEPTYIARLGMGLLAADHADGGRVVRFDSSGHEIESVVLNAPVTALVSAGADTALAASATGAAVLFWQGKTYRLPAGSVRAPLAVGGGIALSKRDEQTVSLRWLDAPDQASTVPIGFELGGAFVRDDGRFAVVWSADEARARVIDLAYGRIVSDADTAIHVSEVTAAGSALFLAHRDEPLVTVIDMAPLDKESRVAKRVVRLPGSPSTGGEVSIGRLATSTMHASAYILAPGSNVVSSVAAGGGLSNTAMSTITIRGDQPRIIARLDRLFDEVAPGRFEATVRLPRGGAYEVISTTGSGGTTSCAGFSVEGGGADEPLPAQLRLVGPLPRARIATELLLQLHNRPPNFPSGQVHLRVDDLAFGGTQRLSTRLRDDSTLPLRITFPEQGRYALWVEVGRDAIEPLVLDVSP